MLLAENKGKIVAESQNSEDYLTSTIFGHLRYIPPQTFWPELFGYAIETTAECNSLAKSLSKKGIELKSYDSIDIGFWPNFDKIGEPDLLVTFTGIGQVPIKILIEVKLRSEKHNQNEEDDQLGRYLSLIGSEADYLIYLTPRDSLSEVEETFEKFSKHSSLRDKLFRLQWQELLQVADEFNGKCSPISRQILADVAKFLKRRGLEFFEGFSQHPSLELIETPTSFFQDTVDG